MSDWKTRFWQVRFAPREQFIIGWRRFDTTHMTMHSLYLGPWEFMYSRLDLFEQ